MSRMNSNMDTDDLILKSNVKKYRKRGQRSVSLNIKPKKCAKPIKIKKAKTYPLHQQKSIYYIDKQNVCKPNTIKRKKQKSKNKSKMRTNGNKSGERGLNDEILQLKLENARLKNQNKLKEEMIQNLYDKGVLLLEMEVKMMKKKKGSLKALQVCNMVCRVDTIIDDCVVGI